MLTITHYNKKYHGCSAPVLVISNCEIGPGIYWIKGENGSGKTTLMKSIAGLTPFEGNITVAGLHIHKDRMRYTKIVNYAEAEPLYPPFLAGIELIDFYKETKGGQYPGALSQNLGVEKFMHQKTGTYSSGMLKKLSLVLAFTGKPALILLDEPLIALDSAAVDVLQSAILQYFQTGVSFLVTSHQPLNSGLVSGTTNLLLKEKTLHAETL